MATEGRRASRSGGFDVWREHDRMVAEAVQIDAALEIAGREADPAHHTFVYRAGTALPIAEFPVSPGSVGARWMTAFA